MSSHDILTSLGIDEGEAREMLEVERKHMNVLTTIARQDNTLGLKQRDGDESPSLGQELVEQLEKKTGVLRSSNHSPSEHEFYHEYARSDNIPPEELDWLECHVSKLNEVPLSVELEKRKRDALKMLQSSFGRAPDSIHAEAKKWAEQVPRLVNRLEETFEEENKTLSEACTDAVSSNNHEAAENILITTMETEHKYCEAMEVISNTIKLRPRLAIDVMVNEEKRDTDTLEALDEIIALSKRGKQMSTVRRKMASERLMCMMKVKKPYLRVGDTVYAKQTSSPDWQLGTIISRTEQAEDYGHGLIRVYTVHFHTEAKPTEVYDYHVMEHTEYELEQASDETEWKGIKRVYDKESKDPWAKNVGWFCATFDGEEHHFAFLYDAFRAYDAHVIQCKGVETDPDEVNKFGPWNYAKSILPAIKALEQCIVTVTN